MCWKPAQVSPRPAGPKSRAQRGPLGTRSAPPDPCDNALLLRGFRAWRYFAGDVFAPCKNHPMSVPVTGALFMDRGTPCSAASYSALNSSVPKSDRSLILGPLPKRTYHAVLQCRLVSRCRCGGRGRGISSITGQSPGLVQAPLRRPVDYCPSRKPKCRPVAPRPGSPFLLQHRLRGGASPL
jgi:hypothetical protein